MTKLIKNKGKLVKAYELGAGTEMESKMITEGKIVLKEGVYYLRSSEVVNAGTEGQIAYPGYYFKVDGEGYPYPNERDFFMKNHRLLDAENHLYEQIPKELEAWFADEPMTDAVKYLIDSGKLKINAQNPDQYFGATLWGDWLTAPHDAAVMFYSITRNDAGDVTDCEFNFVIPSEIEANYTIL